MKPMSSTSIIHVIIATFVLALLWHFKSTFVPGNITGSGNTSIAIHEELKPGKADTLTNKVQFSGSKKFYHASSSNPKLKQATDVPQVIKAGTDSLHYYKTTIADSGFAIDLTIASPIDSLPFELSYSGTFDRITVQQRDTLLRMIETTITEAPPWYNTFYTGAGAVILIITTLLLVLK